MVSEEAMEKAKEKAKIQVIGPYLGLETVSLHQEAPCEDAGFDQSQCAEGMMMWMNALEPRDLCLD